MRNSASWFRSTTHNDFWFVSPATNPVHHHPFLNSSFTHPPSNWLVLFTSGIIYHYRGQGQGQKRLLKMQRQLLPSKREKKRRRKESQKSWLNAFSPLLPAIRLQMKKHQRPPFNALIKNQRNPRECLRKETREERSFLLLSVFLGVYRAFFLQIK